MIDFQKNSNTASSEFARAPVRKMKSFYFLLGIFLCAAIYLGLVVKTVFVFWYNTHTNPFPRNHVFATQKIPGCYEKKLSDEYGLGKTAESFGKYIYLKQVLLLDYSLIAYNRAAILNDSACLGATIQDILKIPFPVNYYILDDAEHPPLLFLHKD